MKGAKVLILIIFVSVFTDQENAKALKYNFPFHLRNFGKEIHT